MAHACMSSYNTSLWKMNRSHCPAYFDRISCWPPTETGIRRIIPCPVNIFPTANPNVYASLLCKNESRWEEKSHYELCIGCTTIDPLDGNKTDLFLIPSSFLITRKYFMTCANGLSVIFLIIGIFILLGNSRLRQYSRNILHVNIFLVFLIRSITQLIAEIFMDKGYFTHNVFQRTDVCNRTTIYFKHHLVDCKLFVVFINYISSSVVHWFVFCEALYLYRLLRAKASKDQIRWYIITGWLAPLCLTIITYTTRFLLKKDLHSCWFEPSIYDWILHGPNVILQILNFLIFAYVCILLVRKLNKTYQTATFSEHRRFAKYSRLARSTLILLPLFGVHYFLFLWNTKPLLISNVILIHLTVHTISSSLQGSMVALIYTVVNCEVQREILRNIDRCLMRHCPSWEQPNLFRDYINKLEDVRLYSIDYQKRVSIPNLCRYAETNIVI
ncbi:unnamed protein product [Rotaria magnacalcarata]|uniref:Uncharacterized protein n=4 Tax=Rotaria magnacalcarata TaxID=392030 RepID=A0A815AJM3_9BILA|nr:unnamed protein product [Rotaria magnacalcarata]CAF1943583.1 unnamed protein product [Rotaria magnacalcarata]